MDRRVFFGTERQAPGLTRPRHYHREKQLKLLFLSCGNQDGLIHISQGMHGYLKENGVQHIWHVDGNSHDPTHWKNSLYHFAPMLFR